MKAPGMHRTRRRWPPLRQAVLRGISLLPAERSEALRRRIDKIICYFGEDIEQHPERLAILPYVGKNCLEVGCGYRRTTANGVAVDLVPRGFGGQHGNVVGRSSAADVAADGAALPFRDASFDSLIARHNLEHYVDTLAVLDEWSRVLQPDGLLAVVVPDQASYDGNTVQLDPTHFHAYTPTSLARLVGTLPDFVDVEVRPVLAGWSFLLTARKVARPVG